ncbi:DUF423 domain-containing protein [Aestuariibacter sp. A3R04]|uniref:DUF423 domain-containing protein n=1 Tax=Aestuariibacter sp. A3R04 TaxID=2841571 RepID=UPI001C09DA90|nr:DUF423 domain-containing protein [Aestuariibacter sp. A3R04]MBU3022587.1 DUF423 domain-containing protein [Aestuariibacter sp. A3R04]
MLRPFLLIGAITALTSVIFGAFGAHALKGILSASQLTAYHTAVDYQFYHALALLGLPALQQYVNVKLLKITGLCFVLGTVLFSGSIYLLTLLEWGFVGPLTPLGGACFMFGWGSLIFGIAKGRYGE